LVLVFPVLAGVWGIAYGSIALWFIRIVARTIWDRVCDVGLYLLKMSVILTTPLLLIWSWIEWRPGFLSNLRFLVLVFTTAGAVVALRVNSPLRTWLRSIHDESATNVRLKPWDDDESNQPQRLLYRDQSLSIQAIVTVGSLGNSRSIMADSPRAIALVPENLSQGLGIVSSNIAHLWVTLALLGVVWIRVLFVAFVR
jgi:hypothetical protein